jgi:hypothetical protein
MSAVWGLTETVEEPFGGIAMKDELEILAGFAAATEESGMH